MRFYSHLSDDERDQIAILRAAGRSMGAIARALGRAKTTISRELQRNALRSGGYSPLHAAGAYQLRRRREAILEREAALRLFVGDRLAEGWTPEQISGWLKSGNEPRLRAIGCETIYAFIYRTGQKAEALWRYLTRRHKRRRPRRARPSRDAIEDRASIHDRPKTIEGRGEAGHWEGDLIICKGTRPVLVLHERKSRVTLAARLTGKTAAETISAMLAVFGHRSAFATINHFRQRHRLRPTRSAQDYARHDDLVLRRLCLMAKRRRRKRQWTLAPMAAAPPRYRPHIRPGNPGDRPHHEPHAPQMPRVQDAIPSLACRAWKGRSNPLLLSALRFAPESRVPMMMSRSSQREARRTSDPSSKPFSSAVICFPPLNDRRDSDCQYDRQGERA